MTMDNIPDLLHYILLMTVVTEILALAVNKTDPGRILVAFRILISGTGVLYICFHAYRLPLYGPFEALVYLLLVMGLLSLAHQRQLENQRVFALCSSGIALGLFVLLWNRPMALNEDYYMYGNPLVIIFFNFRILAGAFLLHGAAQSMAGILQKTDGFFQASRNTLLTGVCIYLTSEWMGSLWCLNWYGDAWHWSRGFLKAAILFLLVMAGFHLPGRLMRNPMFRYGTGVLPGIFITWMLFFH